MNYLLLKSKTKLLKMNKHKIKHKKLNLIHSKMRRVNIEKTYPCLSNISAKNSKFKTMRKEMILEKESISRNCLNLVKKTS